MAGGQKTNLLRKCDGQTTFAWSSASPSVHSFEVIVCDGLCELALRSFIYDLMLTWAYCGTEFPADPSAAASMRAHASPCLGMISPIFVLSFMSSRFDSPDPISTPIDVLVSPASSPFHVV